MIAILLTGGEAHDCPVVQRLIRRAKPARHMLGDKAYDSDGLDTTLAADWGIEMIAAHRANRKTATQDGRVLRRRRRRWKVERLFAWAHNFRRLVTRWEVYPENFLAMWQLAAMLILVKRVL